MGPAPCVSTTPVPSSAYQRAVAKCDPVLRIDALTLVTRLHLLTLCGWRCVRPRAAASRICSRGRAAPSPARRSSCSRSRRRSAAASSARDLIIDSAPIKAWCRADPSATHGHAPAHHPAAFLRSFRAYTLLYRGSGLPVFFRSSPANGHDTPFAKPLLTAAVALYAPPARVVRALGLVRDRMPCLCPARPRGTP